MEKYRQTANMLLPGPRCPSARAEVACLVLMVPEVPDIPVILQHFEAEGQHCRVAAPIISGSGVCEASIDFNSTLSKPRR